MVNKPLIVSSEEAPTSRMRRRFRIAFKKDWRLKMSVGLAPFIVVFFLLAILVFPVITNISGYSSTQTVKVSPGTHKSLSYSVDLPGGASYDLNVHLPYGNKASFTLTGQTYSNTGLGKVFTIASGTLTSNGTYDYHNTGSLEVVKYTVVVSNSNGINYGSSKDSVSYHFSSYFVVNVNPYLFALGVLTVLATAILSALAITSVSKHEYSYFEEEETHPESTGRGRTHIVPFEYKPVGDKSIHPLVFLSTSLTFIFIGFLLNRGTQFTAFLSYIFMALGGATFLGTILFWIIRKD